MRKLFIISLVLLFALPVFAQDNSDALDPNLIEVCNSAVKNIAQAIERKSGEVPGLGNFRVSDIRINPWGLYVINYRSVDENYPYSFGLTVTPIEQDHFKSDSNNEKLGRFELRLPLLGVSFEGYQYRLNDKYLDLIKLTRQYGHTVSAEQQKLLPFELTMEAVKKDYKVREDIEFIVRLRNNTNKMMYVKDLTVDTLFFIYDNKPYGADEVDSNAYKNVRTIKLMPGEAMQKIFRGSGFRTPREVEIYGTYIMTYKDIQPEAVLKLIISK
jgi:hypothetical protein